MTLALLILTASWLLASVLAVCLCCAAKQGDEAQAQRAAPTRRLATPPRARGTTPHRGDRVVHAGRVRR